MTGPWVLSDVCDRGWNITLNYLDDSFKVNIYCSLTEPRTPCADYTKRQQAQPSNPETLE